MSTQLCTRTERPQRSVARVLAGASTQGRLAQNRPTVTEMATKAMFVWSDKPFVPALATCTIHNGYERRLQEMRT